MVHTTAIKIAIRNGNLKEFKILLQEKEWYYQLNDALLDACVIGNLKIVRYLVEERLADVNTPLQGGPIRYASMSGHLHIIKYLVSQGGDLHYPNSDIVNPAAKNGHLPVIKYFIEQGVNIREEDDYPLSMACYYGHFQIAKLLIENGSDINADNGRLLQWACEGGSLEIVDYLIRKNVKITGQAFVAAIVKGHFEMVKYIFQNAYHPFKLMKYEHHLPLRTACMYNKLPIVQFLVENGANIHVYNENPLQTAFEFGNLQIAKYLFQKGAKITDHLNLVWTIKNNFHRMIRYLFQLGVYKNFENVLRLACNYDKFDIIYLILSRENYFLECKHLLTEKQMKQFLFAEKIRHKKQIWAVNTIGSWWIPFCYDLKRESGQRMMQNSWNRVEEMYNVHMSQ